MIHGLLDRIMQVVEIPFALENNGKGYSIRAKNGMNRFFIFYLIENFFLDPRFLDGRCAEILINEKVRGVMGVLHPEVITNFDLTQPCSALELSVEEIY